MNAFSGSHAEAFRQSVAVNGVTQFYNANNTYSYYGIKPYIELNEKGFGFGFGLNIGQMRQLAKGSPDVMRSARSLTDNSSETLYTDVIPAFSIRFGNLSRFFMDYKFNNQFTPAFPVLAHQIAIGFPLDKNGSLVRIGSGSYAGLFIAPSVRIGKNFIVEPTVGFGKGFGSYNSSDSFIGSINLHYKFNRKEKSMK